MQLWRKLRAFIAASVIEQFVWSSIPVWGPAVLVAVLAFLQERPWDILLMMVLGTATLCVAGLFYFTQWRTVRTPQNKMQFTGATLAKVASDQKSVPVVQGIKLGVGLVNRALFPMEFVIDDLKSRIGNRIDNRSKEIGKRHGVGSGIQAVHVDNAIDLSGIDLINSHVEGDFYIKIRYGHPNKPQFVSEYAYAVFIAFDERGDVTTTEINNIDPASFLKGEKNVTWQVPESRRGATSQAVGQVLQGTNE